jgi:hypothetical protein
LSCTKRPPRHALPARRLELERDCVRSARPSTTVIAIRGRALGFEAFPRGGFDLGLASTFWGRCRGVLCPSSFGGSLIIIIIPVDMVSVDAICSLAICTDVAVRRGCRDAVLWLQLS